METWFRSLGKWGLISGKSREEDRNVILIFATLEHRDDSFSADIIVHGI